ncbi:MAG: M23 family metallopeptidase [Eubacteriales bacterium]|jgi:murein DD-endopeptidase MepM/ murein hydrolase activator NlpD
MHMRKQPTYRGRSAVRRVKRKKENYIRAVFQVQVFACVCMLAGAVYLRTTDSPGGSEMREAIRRSLTVSTNWEDLQVFWDDLTQVKNLAVQVFAQEEEQEQTSETEEPQEVSQKEELEEEWVQPVSYQEPLFYQDLDTGEWREDIPAETPLREEILQGLQAPIQGVVTSVYGERVHPITGAVAFHYGVDVAPVEASQYDIHAAAGGQVAKAGCNDTSGNYLLLDHGDGVQTFYAHCSQLYKEVGETVTPGEIIAKVGSTGLSTGDHLHFEVREGEKIYDPQNWVDFQPG